MDRGQTMFDHKSIVLTVYIICGIHIAKSIFIIS